MSKMTGKKAEKRWPVLSAMMKGAGKNLGVGRVARTTRRGRSTRRRERDITYCAWGVGSGHDEW